MCFRRNMFKGLDNIIIKINVALLVVGFPLIKLNTFRRTAVKTFFTILLYAENNKNPNLNQNY